MRGSNANEEMPSILGKFALCVFYFQDTTDILLGPLGSLFAINPSFVLPVSPSTVPLDRQAGQAINLSDVRDTPTGLQSRALVRNEERIRHVLL